MARPNCFKRARNEATITQRRRTCLGSFPTFYRPSYQRDCDPIEGASRRFRAAGAPPIPVDTKLRESSSHGEDDLGVRIHFEKCGGHSRRGWKIPRWLSHVCRSGGGSPTEAVKERRMAVARGIVVQSDATKAIQPGAAAELGVPARVAPLPTATSSASDSRKYSFIGSLQRAVTAALAFTRGPTDTRAQKPCDAPPGSPSSLAPCYTAAHPFPARPAMKLNYRRTLLIGFGFFGISVLWTLYNAYVPIYLQAGSPTFDAPGRGRLRPGRRADRRHHDAGQHRRLLPPAPHRRLVRPHLDALRAPDALHPRARAHLDPRLHPDSRRRAA